MITREVTFRVTTDKATKLHVSQDGLENFGHNLPKSFDTAAGDDLEIRFSIEIPEPRAEELEVKIRNGKRS